MFKKLNKLQSQAKGKALIALKKDGRALLHMATGTGKTETAIKIYDEYFNKNKRMLWLTHKTDLIDQSAGRIVLNMDLVPGVDVTRFNGEEKETKGKVVVASVQSISKASALKSFNPKDFDLVIVDEAHHATAKSWTKVINYFKADKLALTATPYRPDRMDITEHFGMPVFVKRFSDAQKLKVLAQHKTKVILTNSKIEVTKLQGGDYSPGQLDKLFVSMDRNRIIIDSYKKYARTEVKKAGMKPKAICFCINTKHAKRMSKLFNKAGIKADFISSNQVYQNTDARSRAFEKFTTSNEIEVLCSVNILNEGTDIPDVNIGIMARPTRSNIIYSQQIGRLARADGGKKKFFYVLDFVDQTRTIYTPYTIGTLIQKPYTAKEVITEYVTNVDPIRVNERVTDIMSSVENFEDELRLDLLTTKKELEKEADYVLKFGKYSDKVKAKREKN